MATRKSFSTYAPTEAKELEINGKVFALNPSVPGDVLLDFIAQADTEDPASMAKTIRGLLDSAIVPGQLDEWHAFIRDPNNHVTLDTLSEIAGYVSEVMSGNPQSQSPLYSAG